MLQLLVNGFLTVILPLHFLSQKLIWNNVALMIMGKLFNVYKVVHKAIIFFTKDNTKIVVQK